MNAPTYHYDATGERVEDVEPEPTTETERPITVRPPRDPEVVARCNELRRILAEARARRQAAA
jgi:hypothetical protein